MTHPGDDDGKDGKWEWPHPGDLGTILIAGVFLAGMIGTFLFLFSSPEPIKDMFKKPAAESNEVMIPLQQKK